MNAPTDDAGPLDFQRIAEELRTKSQDSKLPTTLTSALLLIPLVYQLFYWLDYPILPMSELLWNSAIYATPTRIISTLESTLLPRTSEKTRDDAEQSNSITHAQKSETMRRVLGLDGTGMLSKLQRPRSLPAVKTLLKSGSKESPPGLGNWDNSCYQNSIIQGLASLPSFSSFLQRTNPDDPSKSTKAALKDIIERLKQEANLGTIVWTPAQLKSMSSWQQQDAQEYFSKLMDEVEKETTRSITGEGAHSGLAAIQDTSSDSTKFSSDGVDPVEEKRPPSPKARLNLSQLPDELQSVIARNPFEGLLAQRVGCLKCGFVEGLSLIPFNCLTLPLGKHWLYDIRSCLDEYTALEPINGVDCAKCTLLQSKIQLEKLQSQFMDETAQELQASAPLVTEALKASVEERLAAVNDALENKDFSDNTILKKCQISQKSKVSSTKTRQAVIARAPKSLAIHINRSVFDEMTGMLSKNYADVRFPLRFSLASWCLGLRSRANEGGDDTEHWNTTPSESMLTDDIADDRRTDSNMYELRAALTHYGRHENGHYICYRRHETGTTVDSKDPEGNDKSWWRFSDEDVSPVSEDNVLAQGGVFMLFYERIDEPPLISKSDPSSIEGLILKTTSGEADPPRVKGAAHELNGKDQPLPVQAREETDAQDEDEATSTISFPDWTTGTLTPDPTTHKLSNPEQPSVEVQGTESVPDPPPTDPKTTDTSSTTAPDPEPPSFEAQGTESTVPDPPATVATTTDTPSTSPPEEPEPDHDLSPSLPHQTLQQTDHRPSFSPSMRTATPRSGRGNKGIGQVSSSSMVTAN
ncbi:MAG: hypothetical protein Q9225_004959 [Loekoesia sp. 1 TL-2023]